MGEENSVAFTRRCDAYIIFSMRRVGKEGLDDEVVQGSGNRFNLQIESVSHTRVIILTHPPGTGMHFATRRWIDIDH